MMRHYALLAGLVLASCVCGVAEAQTKTGPILAGHRAGNVGPSTFLRQRTRLQNLFFDFNGISNRRPIAQTVIPDPASKDFLKGFGFKRLGQ